MLSYDVFDKIYPTTERSNCYLSNECFIEIIEAINTPTKTKEYGKVYIDLAWYNANLIGSDLINQS